MADAVCIRAEILDEMLLHARRERRTECCGLLAGRDGVITAIFRATNALASSVVYEIAPKELFELFRNIRDAGLEHLGQYHSHLAAENFPSPTDIEMAGYPEHAYFIVSPLPHAAKPVRAFSIRDGTVIELEIISVSPEC
jgi:proteasome lid subunit RPN8/RPN11